MNGYHPEEEALEVDWPFHTPRSLESRRKLKERPSKDHVAYDGGERNAADGKDLEQHSRHGKGPAKVEGPSCCHTHHLA